MAGLSGPSGSESRTGCTWGSQALCSGKTHSDSIKGIKKYVKINLFKRMRKQDTQWENIFARVMSELRTVIQHMQ